MGNTIVLILFLLAFGFFLFVGWKFILAVGIFVGFYFLIPVFMKTPALAVAALFASCAAIIFHRAKHHGDSTNRERPDKDAALGLVLFLICIGFLIWGISKNFGFDIGLKISHAIKGVGR